MHFYSLGLLIGVCTEYFVYVRLCFLFAYVRLFMHCTNCRNAAIYLLFVFYIILEYSCIILVVDVLLLTHPVTDDRPAVSVNKK